MMGEEEDGMAPRPPTMDSQSLMTSQNTFGDPNDVPDVSVHFLAFYCFKKEHVKITYSNFAA